MAKVKDRPQQQNGGNGGAGGGGYDQYAPPPGGWQQQPQSHSASEPATGVPPNTPQSVVGSPVGGPGARLDVPTMRPPGFSAAPGAFVRAGGRSWQAPGFPPTPGWETPKGIEQLAVPLPIGTKATHFSGPLVSGGIPQVPLWRVPGSTPPEGPLDVAGTAILTTTLTIDFSMGNFTIPVQFPEDSLIVGFATATALAFTTPPTFSLGKTYGTADIATGPLPAPGGPVTFQPALAQLPLWDAALPQIPFQTFLTIASNTGGTAGLGLILLQYVRIPQRWT